MIQINCAVFTVKSFVFFGVKGIESKVTHFKQFNISSHRFKKIDVN